jgi:hypothetical protein
MFPVSLDCPFLITPSVFSNVYLLPTVCPVSSTRSYKKIVETESINVRENKMSNPEWKIQRNWQH